MNSPALPRAAGLEAGLRQLKAVDAVRALGLEVGHALHEGTEAEVFVLERIVEIVQQRLFDGFLRLVAAAAIAGRGLRRGVRCDRKGERESKREKSGRKAGKRSHQLVEGGR
ncbi:MAG: hypothetical protein BRD37_03215 [Bacteroidetes bacterium QH_8_67_23]|nr:MAG: hypothetical protein BRD37_03215 [Bacteroidetes bacterium QH_8_67_23]